MYFNSRHYQQLRFLYEYVSQCTYGVAATVRYGNTKTFLDRAEGQDRGASRKKGDNYFYDTKKVDFQLIYKGIT